jgi:hypothetical protein
VRHRLLHPDHLFRARCELRGDLGRLQRDARLRQLRRRTILHRQRVRADSEPGRRLCPHDLRRAQRQLRIHQRRLRQPDFLRQLHRRSDLRRGRRPEPVWRMRPELPRGLLLQRIAFSPTLPIAKSWSACPSKFVACSPFGRRFSTRQYVSSTTRSWPGNESVEVAQRLVWVGSPFSRGRAVP